MNFRSLCFPVAMVAGCMHGPRVQALDRTIEALAGVSMKVDSPGFNVSGSGYKANPFEADHNAQTVAVPATVVLDEDDGLNDEDMALVRSVMGPNPFCRDEDRAEVMWNLMAAESACRDAWNLHTTDPTFGPEESRGMLDTKIGFEKLIDECNGSADNKARVKDFYAHVWRPGDRWGPEWNGCFGTPPERTQ